MPPRKTTKKAAKAPRTAAVSGKVKHKQSIGLILPFSSCIFGSDYYIALLLGMVNSIHKAGYNTKLWMLPTQKSPEWNEIAEEGNTAGVLIVGDLIPASFILGLAKRKFPFVLVNNRIKDADVSYVCCDNFNSAYDAVTYLASLGHKRIGMIKGLPSAMDACDRFEGYKEALAENGLTFDEEIVGDGDFTEIGGYKAMKTLFQRLGGKLPSAFFCANDDTAIGALTALREEGKRCPQDVALVGFDNSRVASYVTPPLTTVHQPVLEMGTQAAIMLVEILQGKRTQPSVSILPTELIIRKSCGVDV